MNDVLDAFESPNGTFDSSTAATVRSSLEDATVILIGAGRLTERIVDVLLEAMNEAQEVGRSDTTTQASPNIGVRAVTFVGEGFARVIRICDGWGPVPVPDAVANGHLMFTFTFNETGLDPVVWADVLRCLYVVEGHRVRIEPGGSESDLRLYIGENATPETLTTTPLVLAIDVTATIDDRRVTTKLAVRFVDEAAEAELLVPVSDGSIVVSITRTSVISVRAGNGTFTCDATTKLCTDQTGNVVSL